MEEMRIKRKKRDGRGMSEEEKQEMKLRKTVKQTRKIFIVFFLLCDSPTSEFYVTKRRHIKFRSRGVTQKKEYNIQNKVIV